MTCVEITVLLGIIGALVILVTAAGLRKLEVAQASRQGGAMCR